MRRFIGLSVAVVTCVWVYGLAFPACIAARSLSEQVRERLRMRLENAGTPPRIMVGDELIHASVVLPRFYEDRMYQPAWSENGRPLRHVNSLVTARRRPALSSMRIRRNRARFLWH